MSIAEEMRSGIPHDIWKTDVKKCRWSKLRNLKDWNILVRFMLFMSLLLFSLFFYLYFFLFFLFILFSFFFPFFILFLFFPFFFFFIFLSLFSFWFFLNFRIELLITEVLIKITHILQKKKKKNQLNIFPVCKKITNCQKRNYSPFITV